MEDLKAYIESGVLELYVLGSLSEDEKREVELMLEKHPDLKTEVSEIENALKGYADVNAVNPPEVLRSETLEKLVTAKEQDTPIVPIGVKHNHFYKYAFAASVALLLLSVITLINLYSQLKDSYNQIAILQQSNQKYAAHTNYVESQLRDAKQSLNVFHKPEIYKVVSLKGTPNAPTASMMVAFSAQKSEVMIDVASLKMPANDAQHQYQLWALVNGQPVDLGVFDAKADSAGMIKMKSLKSAEAFAVTLEPKGGSITPTMEQMMAMGSI